MTEATQTTSEKLTMKGLSERISSLDNSLVQILEIVKANAGAKVLAPGAAAAAPVKTAEEVKKDKEIDEASATYETVNPHWVAIAKKTIGSALDHCEVMFPKNGGTIFTVVIKPEYSNAPAEYIKTYGSDRRSREIGQEGIGGAELWCKLIAQNLKRNQPVN